MTGDLSWLDGLEAAHAAATDGPWTERQDFIDQGVPDNSKTLNAADGSYLGTIALTYRGEDNAAAIVAVHNAFPRMAALIRRQQAALDAAKALADELAAKCPPDDWGSGGMEDAIQADTGRAFLRALSAAQPTSEGDHR